MPKLLDAVVANGAGSEKRVVGPCSIFAEGSFGGGTVTIQASRVSGGTFVDIATVTGQDVVIDTIVGPHYLKATLAGAAGLIAPGITVATT